MVSFDAPGRETCSVRDSRTNTPLQALTLLNDVTYVEAARAFAARILNECHGDAKTRIAWAFKQALSREPSPQELPVLSSLLEKQLKRYRYDVTAANALTNEGESKATEGMKTVELAAWTNVARTILNLHETITRN
jgi:hypothetical protein